MGERSKHIRGAECVKSVPEAWNYPRPREEAPLTTERAGTRITPGLVQTWLCSHAFFVLRPRCSTPTARRWLTLHQLRHTRGTELTENGQRLDRVQRVVGHKDPRSTQLYADMAEYQVRQALETG